MMGGYLSPKNLSICPRERRGFCYLRLNQQIGMLRIGNLLSVD